MDEKKHRDLCNRIIRVFYDVYNQLGHGFLEAVYRLEMVLALREAGLHAAEGVPITVFFRTHEVGRYRADILVENAVVCELKATRSLTSNDDPQLIHCLRSTVFEVGLLFNFGQKPEFKRIVFDNIRKRNIPGTDD